nr:hypothetical protein BDDEJBFL_00222 [Agrobacterium fabrum]
MFRQSDPVAREAIISAHTEVVGTNGRGSLPRLDNSSRSTFLALRWSTKFYAERKKAVVSKGQCLPILNVKSFIGSMLELDGGEAG